MQDYENIGANHTDVGTQFEQGKAYFQSGDYDQAERCLQAPARKGNKGAQMLLAYLYEVSETHCDQEKAIFWYEQAAARGEFAAVDALIRLYKAAGKSKRDKLRYWEEKKLKNDDKEIGARYGFGTADAPIEVRPLAAKAAKCCEEAKPVLQPAAAKTMEAKPVASQPVLKTKTVKADPPEDIMWYYRGEDHFYGRGGKRDKALGVECYRKAAELGHAEAQFLLGNCYSLGDGVDKDMAEAMKWYQKACDQGLEKAKTRLSVLQKRLEEPQAADSVSPAPAVVPVSVDPVPVPVAPAEPVQSISVVSQAPQTAEKEPLAKAPVKNNSISKRVNTPKVAGKYAELVRFVAFAQNIAPLAKGNYGLRITYDEPKGNELTSRVWATFGFYDFNEIEFARQFALDPSGREICSSMVHSYYKDICEKAGLEESDWPFGIDKFDFSRVLRDEFYDLFKVIPDNNTDDTFTFKVACGTSGRNALIVYNEVANMLKTYFPKLQAKKNHATRESMMICIPLPQHVKDSKLVQSEKKPATDGGLMKCSAEDELLMKNSAIAEVIDEAVEVINNMLEAGSGASVFSEIDYDGFIITALKAVPPYGGRYRNYSVLIQMVNVSDLWACKDRFPNMRTNPANADMIKKMDFFIQEYSQYYYPAEKKYIYQTKHTLPIRNYFFESKIKAEEKQLTALLHREIKRRCPLADYGGAGIHTKGVAY